MHRKFIVFLFLAFLAGCAAYNGYRLDQRYGKASAERYGAWSGAPASVEYRQDVKPILDSRCAVCHGCYDAPCQLQLGSYQGITRGGSKERVYDTTRLTAAEPTRLFFDAQTNAQWRQKGFAPVLNERAPGAEANREAGVMARLLALKHDHAFPTDGVLPSDRYDFGLDRSQQCPTIEEFDGFKAKHPEWGMPYGFPPLSDRENQVLQRWLESGAPAEPPSQLPQAELDRIAQWEEFLNGNRLKTRLMSRYIYEHWFLAHLYFDDLRNGAFFELVRSRTPPGQPIDLIATRRPFEDPGVDRVYYRLRPIEATLVSKTHMPYPLNPQRMARLREWFIDAPYQVKSLPSYKPEVAGNPFVAFEQLPVRSRYRMMLDEAQFTVMGFIKGPVCRGQVALNVITDYFWIGFMDPDQPVLNENAKALATMLKNVSLPAEEESNAKLFKWLSYAKEQKGYLRAKSEYLNQTFKDRNAPSLAMLWTGDGKNPNAALTVFRHFDSATVVQGLIGEQPQTALIIGYPLLERIHYLLVAGYDVFGNVAHQLEARLYMDFLRMEGEMSVLSMLPSESRNSIRDVWYRGADDNVKEYLNGSKAYFAGETGIQYLTDDPLPEFFRLWKQHLSPILQNRYAWEGVKLGDASRDSLKTLAGLRGGSLFLLPETVFLSVREAGGRDHHFTLLRNSAHTNISELFGEEDHRLPNEDTLTLMRGFVGAYPNAFFLVPEDRLPEFLETAKNLHSEQDYRQLASRFSVRRTDPEFWPHVDALHDAYRKAEPVEAALFDLNRFENR